MTDKELAQRFINSLNELIEIDRRAIENLIGNRVACNEAMANHPSVQVRENKPFKRYSLGTLGLLNGLVGVQDDGWGYIAAEFDAWCARCARNKDGKIGEKCPDCGYELSLGRLIRFELIDHS